MTSDDYSHVRTLLAALVIGITWQNTVIARESEDTEISLKYESELVEEIVVTAEESWRNRPSAEAEWRRKLREYELKDGRFDVEWGYDSAAEEMRAKHALMFDDLNESDFRPVSLLRIRF